MRMIARLFLSVLVILVAACSSAPKNPEAAPKLDQSGALKVHPGLLGLPVPPELQTADDNRRVAKVNVAGADDGAAATGERPGAARMEAGKMASGDRVHFDYKQAEIKPEYSALLDAHARKLAENPKTRLRIEGNADERGSDGFNKRLGAQRAEAVRRALVDKGASEKQIRTASNGEAKPLASGHDETSWAENRRADLVYEREN